MAVYVPNVQRPWKDLVVVMLYVGELLLGPTAVVLVLRGDVPMATMAVALACYIRLVLTDWKESELKQQGGH